jgi:hypothetical protein
VDALAARGLAGETVGEGVVRVRLSGAAGRWGELRDVAGYWPVLDGGGLELPDAAAVARALALGRAFDPGSWLGRRRTVYELADLPPEGPEAPGELLSADALLFVPTELPWAVPAILGLGGGADLEPDAEHHVAVLRRWHTLHGAELAWAGAGALQLHVERPPATLLEAKVLAREQLAYCAGILAEPAIARAARAGAHPLEAIAASRLGATLWTFRWR